MSNVLFSCRTERVVSSRSTMSWSFLTQMLDEISNHSTFMGKIWLSLFIIFRIVLTVVGGESIYYDEQSNFVCNTLQPGCENVCYDVFAPLSHVRYWVFQIIMISTPTVMYLGFAMHKIARMNDEEYKLRNRKSMPMIHRRANRDYEENDGDNCEEGPMMMEEILPEKTPEKPAPKHDGRRRIKRDGLMKIYILQLLCRVILEVGFLFGQYILYGFKVAPLYECTRSPCPHTVNCFVSRPMEKTIFLLIMYAVSGLCLSFTVLEILHLGLSGIRNAFFTHAHHHNITRPRSTICRQVPTAVGLKPEYNLDSARETLQNIDHLQRHLKLARQHLDMVYQNGESSPESNNTAVGQNRLNVAQKKHGSRCDKGIRV
uniref:Gap junction protein n=4 Tax=Cyprinus carpio TaxID=7962 RepID=A0A8C1HFL5_CYPCA